MRWYAQLTGKLWLSLQDLDSTTDGVCIFEPACADFEEVFENASRSSASC
tara:strand:+ start:547 stop:696 length:150 start_codon:yes stop_codon:yes gene_type:complete